MPTKGFTVNADNRNDVLSFWHAIYQASEGYEDRIQWTGDLNATNHATGKGTVSAVFVGDVERRLNFVRALTGSPSHASVNTGAKIVISGTDPYQGQTDANATKAEANQASAYMIARAYQAGSVWADPHDAPQAAVGWTGAAWNATKKSNITQGYYGPGAINAYAQENESGSTDNSALGHRRWVLYQKAADYATGDTPGLYDPSGSTETMKVRLPTNSLYVVQRPDEQKTVGPRFVMYPGAGFFPAPLNSRYWSVSHPNADFSSVTVNNIKLYNAAGTRLGVTLKSTAAAPGDPTLSWETHSTARVTSVTDDLTFRVVIDNIKGTDVPSTLDYTVTLINPDRLTSDQSLTGHEAPPAAGQANYSFTPPAGAEATQVNVSEESSEAWTETAEDGAPTAIVNNTHPSYNYRSGVIGTYGSVSVLSGSKSYQLTHAERYNLKARGVPDQTLEIDREILAKTAGSSTLNFIYKRGFMYPSSTLVVEYTQNNGATWTQLGAAISGINATVPDATPQSWSGTFPASSDPYEVRLRFYKSGSGTTYNWEDTANRIYPLGIFIDNITTANCGTLKLKKENTLAANATRFTLDSTTAGYSGALPTASKLHVRLRTKLGNHWFPYGPAKTVTATATPVAGFNGWLTYEYPALTGGFTGSHTGDGIPNGIKYGFMLDPTVPSTAKDTININAMVKKDSVGSLISISRPANGIRDGVTAEWSDTMAAGSWSSVGVTTDYSTVDKIATATAPAGTGKRFLRWKVTAP